MRSAKTLTKIPALLVTVGILAGLVAGCGTSTSAEVTGGFQDRGRQLFNANCGTCHKMAQAASQGVQGPDLDAAFAAAREVGMDDDTIKGIVKAQVENPRPMVDGFPAISMPAKIVEGNDLEDVAAYIAAFAGVPGASPPKAPGEGPGAQIFANNGCGSCHVLAAAESAGQLGPNLDEAIPDMSRAKIEESIVNPDAEKAPGYENVAMPNRFASIPPDQLKQLIDFLTTSAKADGKSGS